MSLSAEGTKKDEISELHQARLYGHAELAGV